MSSLDELNAALSNYDNVLNQVAAKNHEEDDKVISFMKDFENVARTIIRPAFEEVLTELKKHGHSGSVKIEPFNEDAYKKDKGAITAARIILAVGMKGVKQRRDSQPYVFFNARSDNAGNRTVRATYNLFSSSELETGGHISIGIQSQEAGGIYTLEEITSEIAKGEAITFSTKLFSNVRPMK